MIRCLPLALLLCLSCAAPALAATFTVDSLSDSNAGDSNPGDGICEDLRGGTRCTLRAAIEEANATSTRDYIEFAVGGFFVLNLESALPTITAPLNIDGRTEAGYNAGATDIQNAPPRVYLNGAALTVSTADGLRFFNTHGEVQALGLIGFPDAGIEVVNGTGVDINNCWIGVAANGAADGNGRGIHLNGGDDSVIGQYFDGTMPVGLGNVISANAAEGVLVTRGENNLIGGNRIGTSPDGNGIRGNGGDGIRLLGPNNQIGIGVGLANGSMRIASSRVAYSGGHGINALLGGQRLFANVLVYNTGAGVALAGAGSQVGSQLPSQGNIILANGGAGIQSTGSDHVIHSNELASNAGRGLLLTAGSNLVIRDNLVYSNGDDGARVEASGSTLRGNRIGMNSSDYRPNANNALVLAGSSNIVQDNVLGGGQGALGDGIDLLSGQGNQILDNQIGVGPGTSTSTSTSLPNAAVGVRVRDGVADTLIARNTIGYSLHGIALEGSSSIVCGNFIGRSQGGANIANLSEGIFVPGSTNHIGNSGSCAGNRIGLNGSDGIEISGSDNLIRGNQIGRIDGVGAGNGSGGVMLHAGAARNELIDNDLGYNGNDGVRVLGNAGNGNRIRQNRIAFNGDLGIDLGDDGASANDPGDPDAGPNRRQNFPNWTGVGSSPGPGQYTLTYSIDSSASNASYPMLVDFYLGVRTASTSLQGDQWLGSDSYTSSGQVRSKTLTLPAGVSVGSILATATDAEGNTSEFSNPIAFSLTPVTPEIFANGFESP